jgi:PTS system mannose-specific IIA component
MIGGIIVSHGKLGEELLNSLTIILGEAVNIEAISIGWYDDVEESKRKINQSLRRVDQKNGVLIFTDMFGGKFISLQRSFDLKDVAKKVVEQGRKNIHLASALLRSKN